MVSELKNAMSALKDKNSFNVTTNTVSLPTSLAVSTSANAELGSHELQITSLAKPKLMTTVQGFTGGTSPLNPAQWGTLNINGQSVTVNTLTPDGVVKAINDNLNLGVTAKLVKVDGSANPYKIVLTGKSAENFALPDPDGLFSMTQASSAASFKVDGIQYTRSTNVVDDVLAGVTLTLKAPSADTISLSLARDTSGLKDKFNKVVTAYNDATDLLKEVTNPKSTLETYGGTLVSDATARQVKQQLRDLMTGASSTPGSSVSALWQIGISVDETGKMSADATKLDSALATKFDDVVKALTGNQNNLSEVSATAGGLFGDASRKLAKIIGKEGPLLTQSTNADTQNTRYKADLEKLQTRMDSLLKRYTKQFASMESLVGQVNSQKTSLKSTFEGMMSVYTNK
jgi:flagellar hook-associated protein 2